MPLLILKVIFWLSGFFIIYSYILYPVFLIVVNVGYGMMGRTKAWPFASYPTFAYITKDTFETIGADVITFRDEIIPVTKQLFRGNFSPARSKGLIESILTSDKQLRELKLKSLWDSSNLQNNNLLWGGIKAVQFYKVELSVIPEMKDRGPIKRELISEIHFSN